MQLAWNANPESTLAGYFVYSGTAAGAYTQRIDVGNTLSTKVQSLTMGATYYFAVAAYDTTGLQSAPSNQMQYTVSSGSGGSVSGSTGATAVYLGADVSTKGNWKGVYGNDGYTLAGDVTSYPAYAAVSFQGDLSYTWTTSSTDPRALQEADSTTGRVESCWYTPTYATGANYTIDVNLTDGNAHQIGIYADDWDGYGGGRAETIKLTEANSGAVLDTESLASFQAGEYLMWTVKGHVKITVTNTANGSNALVSAIFFDPVGNAALSSMTGTTGTSGSSSATSGSGTGTSGSNSATSGTTGTSGTTSASTGSTTGTGGGSTATTTTSSTGSTSGTTASGVTSSSTGASVTYVGMDVTTRGNWKGVYGNDGYSLAGDVTSYPAYATVSNLGSLLYTWTSYTTDIRALQQADSTTARIESSWYTQTYAVGANCTMDVNLTDGNKHQIGLYVDDWDGYGGGRAETIKLTDAASGAVLDSESVTSFQAGGYLIWTVRGHVKITVINNVSGSNALVSALFFDPSGTSVSGSTASTTGTSGTSAATTSGTTASTGTTSGTTASTGTTTGTTGGIGTTSGTTSSTGTTSGTTGSTGSASGSTSAPLGTAAAYLGMDVSTHGNWRGVYGSDGFSLSGDVTSYPSYATVSTAGALTYTWTNSSTDVRALQEFNSTTARIESSWYTPTYAVGASYTIDVNFTDGNAHQISLYAADWDGYGGGRAETIKLTNAATGVVLDSESLTAFQSGGYLVWTVSGHIKITIINTVNGSNALVSALFFDPAGASQSQPTASTTGTSGSTTGTSGSTTSVSGSTASTGTTSGTTGSSGTATSTGAAASYVGMDVTTHGSWKGVYGNDGFSLSGNVTSYPAYATVSNVGSLTYTWTNSSTDVRALQEFNSSTARIESSWYTPTYAVGANYTIDVNLTDGNSHQIGLYVDDWDGYGGGRAEIIKLTDATSGAVLDSESISAFQSGGYMIWTVRGHVKITVINNANGSNALVSALFFDPAGTATIAP